MQRLLFVLFQLDEARRYIEDGRLPHLRLALLLLDNAAEIQMDRRIQSNWQRDGLRERLREFSLQMPREHLTEHLRELAEWIPLTRSEKYKIEKFFDEKIAYLVGCGDLDESLAGPLKYLHKYRNEAYHRAKIRSETIRTAALILLEINCHVVINMAPGSMMYSSNEDYSWFQERFGYKHHEVFSCHDRLAGIVDDIRSRVLPTDASVAETLAAHLQNRFADLDDSLSFIVEDGGRLNKEVALCESQFYTELKRISAPSPDALNGFVPKYTLRSISELEAQASQVRTAGTRVDAFHQFSEIEKQLEPIEDCVSNLAMAIDSAIQAEIDRIRGK